MISEGGESECVSLSRAAKILGVCVRTVRREIERGKLVAFRVGRSGTGMIIPVGPGEK